MKGAARALVAFGIFLIGGEHAWASCSSNKLAASDLAGAGFKLNYFTTAGDQPNGAVDMLYFFKGECSCGFAPKTKGIPTKLLYGLRKSSAIRAFVNKYELFPGLCPPPTNTWSKTFFCLQEGVPGCGG